MELLPHDKILLLQIVINTEKKSVYLFNKTYLSSTRTWFVNSKICKKKFLWAELNDSQHFIEIKNTKLQE